MVEDCAYRLVPLGGHRQTCFVERASLAGAVESDDVVAGVAKVDERRGQLLHIAVESAEEDDRALRAQWCESIGGQESAQVTVCIRHGVAFAQLKSIRRPHRL